MKNLLLAVLGFMLCGVVYAKEHVLADTDECKWVQAGDCAVTCAPCPKCPKAKVKQCPKAKKCPTLVAKTCPKAKTKIVTKTKYVNVEKIRYIETTKVVTHTIGIVGGLGPNGAVMDYYDTEERPDEYVFRKGTGGVLGLQYQYRVNPKFSMSALALSNSTYLGGVNFSFGK